MRRNCGNLRSDPNESVPGRNPQYSSFEEAAYIKTNPERAYGKAQSRGGDANTVLEVVSGFLLYGVSVSLEINLRPDQDFYGYLGGYKET